jgi:hypothetical protein
VLLSGDPGGAAELLKTVLMADPTSGDTAILLGGVTRILGELIIGIQFEQAGEPSGKQRLTHAVVNALTLLSKPLLSTSDIATLLGVCCPQASAHPISSGPALLSPAQARATATWMFLWAPRKIPNLASHATREAQQLLD